MLPQESKLILGDPRTDEPARLDDPQDNLYYRFVKSDDTKDADAWLPDHPDGFSEEKCIEDLEGSSKRRLMYYYPTEESDRTVYMLAPSYRIASKFGGTEYGQGFFGDISKSFARYRCAGYQEDGFPAGRWRLPTRGEILFIAQLSANGAFEPLFSSGSTYWSANGAVKVGNGTVSDNPVQAALLRCVYDSWYWGDDQLDDPTVFVWGDKMK